MIDETSLLLGWLSARASVAPARNSDEINMSTLYAYFDPITAYVEMGEDGTLPVPTQAIIYSDATVLYKNGHLIVEGYL